MSGSISSARTRKWHGLWWSVVGSANAMTSLKNQFGDPGSAITVKSVEKHWLGDPGSAIAVKSVEKHWLGDPGSAIVSKRMRN